MNQTFNVNIRSVVLTIRTDLNQRYILSTDSSEWNAPVFSLTSDMLTDVVNELVKKMRELVFTNELELIPQLITIQPGDNPNDLNIVYGFIIQYTSSLNNCFWIEFDFAKEKPYSNLILEVAQKLI